MKSPASRNSQPQRKRGRPRKDDYISLIVPLIRADVTTLEECTAFVSYPGVRTLVQHHQRRILPLGIALKALIDHAVADVMTLATAINSQTYRRMATFLALWYTEEKTVTQVARALGLERTHVAKTVQRPTLELVARRFLFLAELSDPLSNFAETPTDMEEFRRSIA
jgi:hypothetical protein